jgi:very-short-patch-repair endonuclease
MMATHSTRLHWRLRVAERCATQFGVISTADLHELDMERQHLRNLVRSGHLHSVGAGVWRAAGSPVTWEQRLQVGLLMLGPDALVSHEAAAQLHGFEHTPADRVEFLVPFAQRNRRATGRVHCSTRFERLDRSRVGRWPVTSATRTVLDLAMLRPSPRRLEAAIDSAVRSRASSPVILQRRLETLRGPGRWGCAAVERLLVDAGGESVLERRFLALVRTSGLPRPTTQHRIHEDRRTIARVDFAWHTYMVIVEVSGRLGHTTPSERARDAQRRNEIQDIGWKVYEYTWNEVTQRSAAVASTLRARLAAAGWQR